MHIGLLDKNSQIGNVARRKQQSAKRPLPPMGGSVAQCRQDFGLQVEHHAERTIFA